MSRLRAVLLLSLLVLPLARGNAFGGRTSGDTGDGCTMSCCRAGAHMPAASACAVRHASCLPRPAAASLSALPPLVAPAATRLVAPAASGTLDRGTVGCPLPAFAGPPDQPPRG